MNKLGTAYNSEIVIFSDFSIYRFFFGRQVSVSVLLAVPKATVQRQALASEALAAGGAAVAAPPPRRRRCPLLLEGRRLAQVIGIKKRSSSLGDGNTRHETKLLRDVLISF